MTKQTLTDTSPAVAIGEGQTEYMAWKGSLFQPSLFLGVQWQRVDAAARGGERWV